MAEHAVILQIVWASEDTEPLDALEDELVEVVDEAGVGEVDGYELAPDVQEAYVYLYGPDADALFDVVRPILLAHRFLHGAAVLLRYGPPGDDVRERELVLTP